MTQRQCLIQSHARMLGRFTRLGATRVEHEGVSHGLAITLGDMNTFLKASGRRLMPTANMRNPRPGAYMPGVNLHK